MIVRELQDSYRILVQNSDDILTIRDANGRILYTNPSFHRILVTNRKKLSGQLVLTYCIPRTVSARLSSLE